MASILIIDDDEQMRTSLRVLFERSGYNVVDAANGKEGLKIFRKERTDLIIRSYNA